MACEASRPLTLKSQQVQKRDELITQRAFALSSYTGITDLVRGRRLIP